MRQNRYFKTLYHLNNDLSINYALIFMRKGIAIKDFLLYNVLELSTGLIDIGGAYEAV